MSLIFFNENGRSCTLGTGNQGQILIFECWDMETKERFLLRIRIGFSADTYVAFYLYADPDPGPGSQTNDSALFSTTLSYSHP